MSFVGSRALPSTTLRALWRGISEARLDCPACGKTPAIQEHMAADDEVYSLVARCHGSTERFDMPRDVIYAHDDKGLDRLFAWLRNLFVLDALPDIIELLRYNQQGSKT